MENIAFMVTRTSEEKHSNLSIFTTKRWDERGYDGYMMNHSVY